MLAFIRHVDMTGNPASLGNDMWGWEDPVTGQEIAIVFQTDGTTFLDVSDPVNPAILGRLNTNNVGQQVAWRDGKVFDDHVFIISEGADHGMQVFDLRTLRGLTHQSPARLLPAAAQYDEFGKKKKKKKVCTRYKGLYRQNFISTLCAYVLYSAYIYTCIYIMQ